MKFICNLRNNDMVSKLNGQLIYLTSGESFGKIIVSTSKLPHIQ